MFRGFPLEAISFYEGLAADNSKAYWQAHVDVYESCVREPLEDLLAELAPEFGDAKVFRPYRDVRFSKDKTPYKLAAAAVVRPPDAVCGHTYVELGAGGLRVGGGAWHLDREQLERARRAIDAPGPGRALEEIQRSAEGQGMTLFEAELRTAPRGYPRDHPRIDLLRRRRFAVTVHHEPGPWLATPEARDRVVAGWHAARPLNDWLDRHADPADPAGAR